ncbi:MAG: 50S ribosomal protein L29 [Clostridiales bacterium]|nr:50S ribosomal protein L29 [Clostridiales bacterium]
MKAAEIRALSEEQRKAKLKELKEELFNLHFQQAINQLDNPMRIKAVRKDIARIKTVEREIELEALNS